MKNILYTLLAIVLLSCNKDIAVDIDPQDIAEPDYNLLSEAFKKAGKKPYPQGDNYVIEYSLFLKQVAGEL